MSLGKPFNGYWVSQKPIPCYNFGQPFRFSSNEFIISNSSKFKEMPFIIYKFNCKQNKWNRINIRQSQQEDPAKLIIQLQNHLISIQSTSVDPRIMDHHGTNNVGFDIQTKKFYAIGLDWKLWEVDLSKNPAMQSIRQPSSDSPSYWQLHGNDYNRSYICQPYLFLNNFKPLFVLTPDGTHRYSISQGNIKIRGLHFMFILYLLILMCFQNNYYYYF